MNKEEKLRKLKENVTKDLQALFALDKERETFEKKKYPGREAEVIRKGMLESLTESYFAQLLKIAKEEEEIEKLSSE